MDGNHAIKIPSRRRTGGGAPMRGAVVAFAAAMVTAFPLAAQHPSPPPDAPAPALRTFTLRNGMRVTLVHVGSEQRAVVRLALRAGAIDEPPFAPGLASLAAGILLEGTVSRSRAEVDAEARRMGGELSVSAGNDITWIGGEVRSADAGRFASLLSDVVRHPALNASGYDSARASLVRELPGRAASARGRALRQLRWALFPAHPFGRPFADSTELASLRLGHVRNFLDDDYGASRAHLYVSGVFDDAVVERDVRAAFSDWIRGDPSSTPAAAPPLRRRRQVAIADRSGDDRASILIGLPVTFAPDSDGVALELAGVLLERDVRRAAGADAAEAGVPAEPALWSYAGVSYWSWAADVPAAATGEALTRLFGAMQRLQSAPVADDDLDAAKRDLLDRFNAERRSRTGLTELLERDDLERPAEPTLLTRARWIAAVRAADVRRVAAAQLDPTAMTIVVAGDSATIEPQVAPWRLTPPLRAGCGAPSGTCPSSAPTRRW